MTAILLFLVIPLLPVFVAALVHSWRPARVIAPWVPLSGLLLLPLQGEVVEFPWLLLGARVGLDPLMLPLLGLAAVVWTIAGWHASLTIAAQEQPRFFLFWLATWCGNLCVFLTLDAASFYAAYAMMTIAAWGLIVHRRRAEDYHAGRVYIVMALIGEACLITGLLALGAALGNFPLDGGTAMIAAAPNAGIAVWLLTIGFAVKMGLIPLHMWLPLAHPRAPVPASAVLSGVMLLAGLAGWLRFLPPGGAGFANPGDVLLLLGLASAFAGAAIGLCQSAVKVILAYSSVSQMGLVTALVGLALRTPEQAELFTTLAVLFAVHHGLAKAALFLGVDLVRGAPRVAHALLWLPAASLAGLPLTSGALAKTAWKGALPPAVADWLEPLLYAGSVLTALLMVRFLSRVRNMETADEQPGIVPPWLLLLGAGLALPWVAFSLHDPAWVARPLQPGYVWAGLWPIALALVFALVVVRVAGGLPRPNIPEGDLVVLFRIPSRFRLPLSRPGAWRWDGTAVLDRLDHRLAPLSVALGMWLLLLVLLFVRPPTL